MRRKKRIRENNKYQKNYEYERQKEYQIIYVKKNSNQNQGNNDNDKKSSSLKNSQTQKYSGSDNSIKQQNVSNNKVSNQNANSNKYADKESQSQQKRQEKKQQLQNQTKSKDQKISNYNCEICNIKVRDQKSFFEHMQGKKHRQKTNKLKPNYYRQHIQGKKHQTNINKSQQQKQQKSSKLNDRLFKQIQRDRSNHNSKEQYVYYVPKKQRSQQEEKQSKNGEIIQKTTDYSEKQQTSKQEQKEDTLEKKQKVVNNQEELIELFDSSESSFSDEEESITEKLQKLHESKENNDLNEYKDLDINHLQQKQNKDFVYDELFDENGFLLESEEILFNKSINDPILSIVKQQYNYYQSRDKYQRKKEAFKQVKNIVIEFFKELSKKHKQKNSEMQFYHYGGTRLGISSPNGDLDCICIFPKFVDFKKDFFFKLYFKLQRHRKVQFITKIFAKVPLIRFIYDGIDFDLIYCQIQQLTVPVFSIKSYFNPKLWNKMTTKCKHAFNGILTSLYINSLFESKQQAQLFRHACFIIKFWAKQKAVYSSIFAYLGGICWVVLTVKIILENNVNDLESFLKCFLSTYSQMDFSKNSISIINEKTKITKNQIINIINPITKNNMSESAYKQSIRAIKSRLTESNKYFQNRNKQLVRVFEKYDFFHDFDYFLEIELRSRNKMTNTKWGQSFNCFLLKDLVQDIEMDPDLKSSVLAQAYPQVIQEIFPRSRDKASSFYYIGMRDDLKPNHRLDNNQMKCIHFTCKYLLKTFNDRFPDYFWYKNQQFFNIIKRQEISKKILNSTKPNSIINHHK